MRLKKGKHFLTWEGLTILIVRQDNGADLHILRGPQPELKFTPAEKRKPGDCRKERRRCRKRQE